MFDGALGCAGSEHKQSGSGGRLSPSAAEAPTKVCG